MVKSFVNELLDRGFGPLPMDSALVYDTEDACAFECGMGVNRNVEKFWRNEDPQAPLGIPDDLKPDWMR